MNDVDSPATVEPSIRNAQIAGSQALFGRQSVEEDGDATRRSAGGRHAAGAIEFLDRHDTRGDLACDE